MSAHLRLGPSNWGAVTTTHYETLGVRSDASLDEIRAAYRARARDLHPDRFEGAAADRQRVEQQMRAVNEAWSVLRDPLQRSFYDQSLRPVDTGTSATERAPFESASAWGTAAPASAAGMDDAAPVDVGPLWHRVVGLMPWLAILVALVAIFVFTAYAVHGGFDASTKPTPTTAFALGQCVHIDPGPATSSVPCTQPNDGRIVAYAGSFSGCPAGTEARRLQRSELLLACLARA